MAEDDDLDDATVEALLAARYKGDASDLVALSDVLEGVRSFAEAPVPSPSAALAPILRGSAVASDNGLPAPRRRWLRGPGRSPFRQQAPGLPQRTAAPPRRKVVGVPVVAAAISAALVAVAAVAGSARLLPGPTQDVVARIVRTVTPFDFPERSEPEAVLSRAPRPEPALPSERPVSAGAGAPPGVEEPGAKGNQATGSDPSGGGAQGPTVIPRPAATVPGLAAPTVPTTNGRHSDGGGGTASTVPSRPPPKGALTADLVGAPDPQRPGLPLGKGTAALESNPGRGELCLTLVLSGTTPVTAVHLHAGAVGLNGPVVATFPGPRTPGTSRVCVTVTDQVIKEIRKEPGEYYVDVHTADPVNGTLSGTLTK